MVLSGTVYRLASSMSDHTPALFNVYVTFSCHVHQLDQRGQLVQQSLKDTDGRRRTDEASYVCSDAWQLILATGELVVRHRQASIT